VIEGLAYAAFPEGMKRMLEMMAEMPGATLRSTGLVAVISGLVLLLIARWVFSV